MAFMWPSHGLLGFTSWLYGTVSFSGRNNFTSKKATVVRIRHLQYFLIVAEELSFTRAAAKANIESPPLSRAAKVLEDELGVPLLERTRG